MNGQRSETGLNWCSVDWGKSSITTRDRERRCDCAHSTTAVIGGGASSSRQDCPERARLGNHRGASVDRDGSCCIQRTGGDRSQSGLPVTRRSDTERLCQSCVTRGSGPDAGNGMTGWLTAGTNAAAGPTWRQAKGVRQRGHGSQFHSHSGALLCLHRWVSTARVFPRSWIVYLFCYLILLNSGWSLSYALEDPRQSSDGTNGGVKTVEEYLKKNFPERFNESDDMLSEIQSDSAINNRVRLGRAGGKFRAASTNYNLKLIDKESARASCQPRDTVLDSYEELSVPKGYNSKVFPECIVVRRCKHGGCCRDDQECVPRSNGRQNVSKLFLINTRITTRYIEEDTDCECVEKPDFCSPPETDCPPGKIWSYGQCGCICRYRCPKPFLQDETTCACDCLTNNRVCKNIQRGRKDQRIVGEECECVRRGLCGFPNCSNGRFSTSKCKCAQEERRWS